MKRNELVNHLNTLLKLGDFAGDVSNNGLQVEGADEVTKIAYGVDASLAMAERAAEAGAEFIFVHHGLSWGGEPRRFTGVTGGRFRELFRRDLSLYAVHLPLDAHELLGHNACLCRVVGLRNVEKFCPYHGMLIGWYGELTVPELPAVIGQRVAEALISPPDVRIYGSDIERPVRRVGAVSGGGGFDAVDSALANNLDLLITGEMSHEIYNLVMESGLTVIALGHYASETIGVAAVKEWVERELGVPGVWIDLPTGL